MRVSVCAFSLSNPQHQPLTFALAAALSVYGGKSSWKKHVCEDGSTKFGSPLQLLRVIWARRTGEAQGAKGGAGSCVWR